MAKKICVANQKGGVGKTTTAICLAQELRRRKKKVLFIDSDAQCNSTSFYGAKVEDQATIIDIFCADDDATECIQHTDVGDIIASDPQLKDAETIIKLDEMRFLHLKMACRSIEDEYDYVIIDTPPNMGVTVKNVLAYVDAVIIPAEESGWSMAGLMDFTKSIELAKLNNPNIYISGILLVKSKERTKKSKRMKDLAQTLADKLNTKTFNTKIRESVACTEALTEYYVPLHEYAPKSTTCEDYERFTTELLKDFK